MKESEDTFNRKLKNFIKGVFYGYKLSIFNFEYKEEYRSIIDNNIKTSSSLFKKLNKTLPSIYSFNFTNLRFIRVIDRIDTVGEDTELTYPQYQVYMRQIDRNNQSFDYTDFYFYHKYYVLISL